MAELGLKNYVHALDAGDPQFIAIPVYPVRLFLHSAIFINKKKIAAPKDLIGGKVGELFSLATTPQSGRAASCRTTTASSPRA